MNYLIQIDPIAIYTTGAAVDNVEVFGSLKMARAALDHVVDAEITARGISLDVQIASLRMVVREEIANLRAARTAALKVREGDLKSDETIPVLGPPAAPAAAVSDTSAPSGESPTTAEATQASSRLREGDAASECDHAWVAGDTHGRCIRCGAATPPYPPNAPTAGAGDGLERFVVRNPAPNASVPHVPTGRTVTATIGKPAA